MYRYVLNMEINRNPRLLQEIREGGGGLFDQLFSKILLRLIRILSRYKRSRYNRVLTFGDLFIDRTEKAKFLGFGEGTTIYDSSLVIGDVKVGKNSWIGPFTVLDGSGGLTIGDYCSISAGVHIYTHDTVKWALSGGTAEYEHSSVRIGNCCYIGPHAIVSKGVKIGNHCIIGANSVVNTDLDDNLIAVGSPCKIIGKVKRNEHGQLDYEHFE